MNFRHPIAYFNSNSVESNYLCFGEGEKLMIQDAVCFEKLQSFIDSHKGKFIYGYIGYDTKNSIENLSSRSEDLLNFPTIYFHIPKNVVKINKDATQYIQGEDSQSNTDFIKAFLAQLESSKLDKSYHFQPRISKEDYIKSVNNLKEQIQRGDIYEINFCQEFYSDQVEIDDPIAIYSAINQVTKAPFSAYLQQDDLFVFCGSPERFIQKKGNKIISQPIKGTAPRGLTEIEDLELKNRLLHDPKERSENVMIVDLVRNDLSKIAKDGSVKVDELFGVYSFDTVHQLISTISCELPEEVDFSTIIKATFPMGSMTGAPKISAMKLSEEYESFKRGLYSGTIGYILPNGDFDFNVVIRTLLYNASSKYLSCGVGGAITINSDAEKEYQECETKVKKLLNSLSQ